MVGNVIKITAVLIIGYFVGWIIGGITGAFLGAVPGLFFHEIVYYNQTVLMSLTLCLVIGGVIGFLATQFINKVFEAVDKPVIGVLIGIIISVMGIFFRYGIISISAEDTLKQSYIIFPVLYGVLIGNDVGSFAFPVLGMIRVIRDMKEDFKEVKNNKDRLDEIMKFMK